MQTDTRTFRTWSATRNHRGDLGATRVVGDLMTAAPPIVPAHLPMNAARKIAALKAVTFLLVEAEGRLVGTLDGMALAERADQDLISACMTPISLVLTPTTGVARAHALLLQHQLPRAPVLAGMFAMGTVSRDALERFIARPVEARARAPRAAA